MILWTLVTGTLGYNAIGNKNARIAFVCWMAFSVAMTAIGGPAID
jgi:hypothetical protein